MAKKRRAKKKKAAKRKVGKKKKFKRKAKKKAKVKRKPTKKKKGKKSVKRKTAKKKKFKRKAKKKAKAKRKLTKKAKRKKSVKRKPAKKKAKKKTKKKGTQKKTSKKGTGGNKPTVRSLAEIAKDENPLQHQMTNPLAANPTLEEGPKREMSSDFSIDDDIGMDEASFENTDELQTSDYEDIGEIEENLINDDYDDLSTTDPDDDDSGSGLF